MKELLAQLAAPFKPEHVTWKPGSTTKDGTKCMAMAYADLRAYMERLDEVCGIDWSVRYAPWGDNRIMCELTLYVGDALGRREATVRSSTGEMAAQDVKNEMGGTVAEAQAFKRAAAMFGLGRYLYDLPSTWVDFDAAAKRISKTGQAELDSRYNAWYAKTMAQSAKRVQSSTPARAVAATPQKSTSDFAALPASPRRQETEQGSGQTAKEADVDFTAHDDLWNEEAAPASEKDKVLSAAQLARLHALGSAIYGDGWNAQREKLVAAVSKGAITSSKQLSPDEATTLIRGLEHKQAAQVQATNGMVATA